jgi:iron complex outermembrane receptor protein
MIKTLFRRSPLALAIALLAQNALAQGGIEQVTVTAQKREQALQETPIAVSALTSEQLERQDIHDIAALNGLVPNMRLVPPPTASTGSTINIRGAVTINPALPLEATVGLYLDGIYLGKSVGSVFDIADLERVEVLRGPQGTLYGKNTIGGAINLVTKRPTGEFGGDIKVTVGDYGLRSGRASIDLPALGEVGQGAGKLSTKLVINRTARRGFFDNEDSSAVGALPASGDDFGNVDSTSGRVALLWQPTDAVDVLYSYDGSHVDQRPQFFQITRLAPAPALEFLQPFASDRRLDSGSQNAALHDRANVDGHSLTASFDAGALGWLGDVTFKSLTGHREVDALDEQDWDGSPFELLHSARDMMYRATSQEFQMIGKTERVNYVGGLYYFKERGHVLNPQMLALLAVPAPIDSRYGIDNEAWAAFAQLEWTPPILDDRLSLTLGGRYTEEDKQVDSFNAMGTFVVLPKQTLSKDYDNFSPTLVASYRLTDSVNVYGKVARGWKAGLFNAESADIAELSNPTKEETVTSYELGMKSQWLDNRLQANVAAFYDDHEDMQISSFQQVSSVFTNAGGAHIRGIEIELLALPIDNLEVSLNYGYIDADYTKYIDRCSATPTGQVDCPAGVAVGQRGVSVGGEFDAKDVNKFPYTPKNTANLGVQYTQPLALGEVVGRVDWSYTDDYAIFPDPYSYENTSIDSYQLVDLRVSWEKVPLQTAQLSVGAWVKNLTDKQYRVNGLEWGPITTMHYGDPRTFGIDVGVKF